MQRGVLAPVRVDGGEADDGRIVIDELVGYLDTVAFLAFTWTNALLGFAFFRLFDIAKPWPIGWLDRRVKGGFGIMIDDIVAGLYTAILLAGAEAALLAG